MKKSGIGLITLSAFALFAFILSSCSESDEGAKYARLEIRLTDAPGDYEEVNVDIQGLQVHASSGEGEGGWISVDVNKGVYNLLELTGGLDVLLGTAELPPGRISQIRLILGDNNSLKVNGNTVALKTPSAQQTGLKVNVHADLVAGVTYTVLLDFDAARSVVKAGNSGMYLLKPVIRGIVEATAGAISGTLSNPAASPAVYAIIDLDTLGSAFADEAGKFIIKGLDAGTYKLGFDPAEGFVIEPIEGVVVNIGQVTDVGEVLVEEE
jgi:hypothetical protein